jgi:hypothetical protein
LGSAPRGAGTKARNQSNQPPAAAAVTEIIPFSEFGKLADANFRDSSAFDRGSQVTHAPELDDLHHSDDLTPLRLAVPVQFRPEPRRRQNSSHAYRGSNTDVSDGLDVTDVIDISGGISGRPGLHRKPEPVGAVKSRLLIAAMAVGATATGAHTVLTTSEPTATDDTVLAAGATPLDGAVPTGSTSGMQIVPVASTTTAFVHTEELTKAIAYAEERAEREARLQRPQVVMPTKGLRTSGFGYRWGVLHGGIDIAGPIGTPIVAAADGVVIDVGPTAGYGAWVKLRHADGTVTLYGHVNSWLVSVGQQVMAGDQIATIGNRGNSTGPHLHFEVLLNGSNRVDPAGWLAKRGLSTGSYVG